MAYSSLIPLRQHYAYIKKRDDLLLVFTHLAKQLEPEKKQQQQDPSEKERKRRTKPRQFSASSACKALIVDILDFRAGYVLSHAPSLKETDVWDTITIPELAFQLREEYSEDVIARCIQEMLVEGSWRDDEGQYGEPGHIYTGTLLRKAAGMNSYAYQLHYPVLRGLVAALPSESPFNVWQRKKWPKKRRGGVLRFIGGQAKGEKSSDLSGNLEKSPPIYRGTDERKPSDKSENVPILLQSTEEGMDNNSPEPFPQAPTGAVVDLHSVYSDLLDELALRSWNLPTQYDPEKDLPGSTPQWNMALIRAVAASYLPKPPFRPGKSAWAQEQAEWEQALQDIYYESVFRLSGIVELARLMRFMQDPSYSGWAAWLQQHYPKQTVHPRHILANWQKCSEEMARVGYLSFFVSAQPPTETQLVAEPSEEEEDADQTEKRSTVTEKQRSTGNEERNMQEHTPLVFPSSPALPAVTPEPEAPADLTPGLPYKDILELRKHVRAAHPQADVRIRSVRSDGATDLGFRLLFSNETDTWFDFRSFEEWTQFQIQTRQTLTEAEEPFSASEAS